MKKMLYVTVSGRIGADEFNVCVTFDLDEARKAALNEWKHLTDREREKSEIRVDGYRIEVEDEDTRDAKEVYMELLDEDDDSIMEPAWNEVFLPPWTSAELRDIALSLEANGYTPEDQDRIDLTKFERCDRKPFDEEEVDEIYRHLGKESGVDYRKKPRKTNSSRIAAARIEKGWTQAQLAEVIGVDQQHIARWENGVRNPKIEALLKIAEALGVDVKTLIQQ